MQRLIFLNGGIATNYFRLLLIIALFGAAIALTGQANAQNIKSIPGKQNASAPGSSQAPARLVISHRQPKPQDLPYPGQILNLIAQIENTKKTDMDLRLFATHDGRALELQALPGYLDKYDLPTYEIPIHAPKFNISYQFVLTGRDGEALATTKRFSIERACLPNLNLAQPEISKEITGEARLERVSAEVENLQNDLDGYRRVREVLDSIVKEIEFLDEASEK